MTCAHTPALRLRDCQPGQAVHLHGPKGYPFVSIDGHVRLIDGALRVIPAHWRRIADAEPDAGAVVRDDRTGELFGEVETICALAAMPDGAVISGALLMAARKEWR